MQYRQGTYADLRRYDIQYNKVREGLTDAQAALTSWNDYWVSADGAVYLMSNSDQQDIYERFQSSPDCVPGHAQYYPPGTLDGVTIVDLDRVTIEGVWNDDFTYTPGTHTCMTLEQKIARGLL